MKNGFISEQEVKEHVAEVVARDGTTIRPKNSGYMTGAEAKQHVASVLGPIAAEEARLDAAGAAFQKPVSAPPVLTAALAFKKKA